jgi:hypothetical protein
MSLGTSQSPIVIPEASTPGDENIMFSKRWCDGKSFKQLLDFSANLPGLVSKFSVDLKRFNPAKVPAEFCSLRYMPSTDDMAKVHHQLGVKPDHYLWVNFKNYYSVHRNDLPMLWQIVDTVSKLRELQGMNGWLRNMGNEHDAKFATHWRSQMLKFTLDSAFIRFGQKVQVTEFFKLRDGTWLNDGNLEFILHFFRQEYKGHVHGPHLFIPLFVMNNWIRLVGNPDLESYTINWNWGIDIDLREYKKAYTIVHMGDHWGAIAIDFENRTIAFGDSMYRPAPPVAITAVTRWIRERLGHQEAQHYSLVRLAAKRPKDGASCGVIAALAIENDIHTCPPECSCSESANKAWEKVHSKSPNELRVRYLSLLSGLSEVC